LVKKNFESAKILIGFLFLVLKNISGKLLLLSFGFDCNKITHLAKSVFVSHRFYHP